VAPRRKWFNWILRLFGVSFVGYFATVGVGAVLGVLAALGGDFLNLRLPFLVPLAVGIGLIGFGISGIYLQYSVIPRLGPRPGSKPNVMLLPVVHEGRISIVVSNDDPAADFRAEVTSFTDHLGVLVPPHRWRIPWETQEDASRETMRIIRDGSQTLLLGLFDGGDILRRLTNTALTYSPKHIDWTFGRLSAPLIQIDYAYPDGTEPSRVEDYRYTITGRIIREEVAGHNPFKLELFAQLVDDTSMVFRAVCLLVDDLTPPVLADKSTADPLPAP
jgi:hypothetical protein